MTDNEIIKALREYGETYLEDHALVLILRQKAEIAELEAEIDKQYEQAKADILGNMSDGGTSCHWCIEQHRAEAIKGFADELKRRLIAGGIFPVLVKNEIDNIVEEMTEDKNDR